MNPKYTISDAPFSWRHAWIVAVASLGQMLGTLVATVVSVIIPMIQIVARPELASWQQGVIGAADLVGIALGAGVLGKITNRYGYLACFRICPAIVAVVAVACVFMPYFWVSVAGLFVIGIAIGGEYSLDSDYVSELMPAKWRSTMVGVTKTASALGNIIVAGLAWILIMQWKEAGKWPDLFWMVAVAGGVMFLSRLYFRNSPKWLAEHGRVDEANEAVTFFLGKNVRLDLEDLTHVGSKAYGTGTGISVWRFLRGNFRKFILTGVPWACEGLGVYGIGVFLPILVLALGIIHEPQNQLPIFHVASSVELTFWISCLILPGFVIGLGLIRKMTTTRQLAMGFYVSAVAMLVLLLAYWFKWPAWISITSFMVFEVFLNLGPHLMTYVLPPEVYPVATRSMGSGIAASMGKIGAVLAVFFIPVLLHTGGIELVLGVSLAVMAAGGIVTDLFASAARQK